MKNYYPSDNEEVNMLTTGNQLRAARAMAGLDQGSLARLAGVNINTISAMEKKGADRLTSGLDKITAIMLVLEDEGIEFLNHGNPGVRLVNQLLAPNKNRTFSDIRSLSWSDWAPCGSDGEAVTEIRKVWINVTAQGSEHGGACHIDEKSLLPVGEWRAVSGRNHAFEYRYRK